MNHDQLFDFRSEIYLGARCIIGSDTRIPSGVNVITVQSGPMQLQETVFVVLCWTKWTINCEVLLLVTQAMFSMFMDIRLILLPFSV